MVRSEMLLWLRPEDIVETRVARSLTRAAHGAQIDATVIVAPLATDAGATVAPHLLCRLVYSIVALDDAYTERELLTATSRHPE